MLIQLAGSEANAEIAGDVAMLSRGIQQYPGTAAAGAKVRSTENG